MAESHLTYCSFQELWGYRARAGGEYKMDLVDSTKYIYSVYHVHDLLSGSMILFGIHDPPYIVLHGLHDIYILYCMDSKIYIFCVMV